MKVFVIMPFDDKIANDVYSLCTKPICESFGLKVCRADEFFTSNPILDDIVAAIEESAVVIADISGKNPNVFYEVGMSHMLKRPQTIMITHDEFERIPFDIAHFRIIKYENSIGGKTTYEDQLRKTLENILKDYKTIYKNEFGLMIKVLSSAKKESDLYAVMSLAKAPKPLPRYDRFRVEGHNEGIGNKHNLMSISVESGVSTFLSLGYAEISGNIIILTDKGKAFVELLDEKGFVCDYVNGYVLSEGYVPFYERMTHKVLSEKKPEDAIPDSSDGNSGDIIHNS